MRMWSTDRLPEPEQFPFWREVVWDAFVPVSLSRGDDGRFASSVSARSVGAIGVSRIASQPQSVARTPALIERRAGDVFFLNMPLSEGSSASQGGRTASLRSGDFVLVDSARPFQLRFRRPFRQISLMLPHESLAPLLAAPWEATATSIPGDRGVGAVAAGAIKALATARGPFDRHAARALTNQIAALVVLAVGGLQPRAVSAGRALLLQAALDEIERSLGDPELSPARVAERVGISTRYLHSLFADRGPSFGRWLLARRLDQCRCDLDDPIKGHWTIAEIACQRGFHDPSYFARAFKAHYGVSPSGYRQTLRTR